MTTPQPTADHLVKISKFSRGLTPTRPQRTLWGYTLRCSCGWLLRTNENRRRADKLASDHRKEAPRGPLDHPDFEAMVDAAVERRRKEANPDAQ